jgi:pre-rRNA-processing protein IPI1
MVTHATRGLLPGPYAKLSPPSLKRLVLDAVATLLCDDRSNGETLTQAVTSATTKTAEEGYWRSIYKAAVARNVPPLM